MTSWSRSTRHGLRSETYHYTCSQSAQVHHAAVARGWDPDRTYPVLEQFDGRPLIKVWPRLSPSRDFKVMLINFAYQLIIRVVIWLRDRLQGNAMETSDLWRRVSWSILLREAISNSSSMPSWSTRLFPTNGIDTWRFLYAQHSSGNKCSVDGFGALRILSSVVRVSYHEELVAQ